MFKIWAIFFLSVFIGQGAVAYAKSYQDSIQSQSEAKKDQYSIHQLAERGQIEKLKKAIAKDKACVNERDERGCTPLFGAIIGNQLEAVRCLINAGADVNSVDKNGVISLHLAAGLECSDIKIVCVLLEHGARVNEKATAFDNKTPLIMAIQSGISPAIITLLLEKGADPAIQDTNVKLSFNAVQWAYAMNVFKPKDSHREEILRILQQWVKNH